MALYVHTFKVRGGTRFPLDMLRYDACFPATGEDAAHMDDCLNRDVSAKDRIEKAITLIHVSDHIRWTPTVGRWESFLWHVVGEAAHTKR